ncbi:MAG: shikimate dehydrogenase [Lachnospiraceae bacterium]|nr:shikimate dehydrogenase [Lachnospiraceae bacterium]
MEKYGLIGNPVKHSLSPFIHGQIYEAMGIEGQYELYEIKDDLCGNLKKLYNEGLKGINVTVPYKSEIMACLCDIDPVAKAMGAVNTLIRDEKRGGYIGANTDVSGLKRELKDAGISLKNKNVVIIGGGGAARAAAFAAITEEPASVTLVNRNPEKIQRIREDLESYRKEHMEGNKVELFTFPLRDIKKLDKEDYIAIQCTSLGLSPDYDSTPIEDEEFFKKLSQAVDVIYTPKTTRFMQLCRDNGVPACNGLKMLLYQAIDAFELWTGRKVPDGLTEEIYEKLYALKTRNLVLIGFMGSGKSSVGKKLAELLGYDFMDADSIIEKNEGKSINLIFKEKGEEYFRDREEKLLKELSEKNKGNNILLSAGGGMILRENNRKYLKNIGLVIYLKASADTIKKRLQADTARPLLAEDKSERIDRLLAERSSIYEDACDIVIDTDKISINDVVLKGERRV